MPLRCGPLFLFSSSTFNFPCKMKTDTQFVMMGLSKISPTSVQLQKWAVYWMSRHNSARRLYGLKKIFFYFILFF